MSGAAENGSETTPAHLRRPEIERVAREFTLTYHDLKAQTFGTTTWLGVPLVKTPSDMLAFQQIIAETRPELIIETGVYVGGSALMFASIMDLCGIDGKVIAIDVDLSAARDRVREHPRIELIEGSSTDPEVVARIRSAAEGKRVMVDLDSDHRAHHVLAELELYAPLVTPGCYLVVEDGFLGGRPVRPDAVPGPSEAIDSWLAEERPFVTDRWHERFLMTQNPRGYMRRVGDGSEGEPRPPRPDDFEIGALELSGAGDAGPTGPQSAEQLERDAGEPDREVEALRKTVDNLARADRRAAGEAEMDRRAADVTTSNLLREIEAQRELLRERDRLLARERTRLRRIEGSLPFRLYRKLRKVPLLGRLLARRDHQRLIEAKNRSERRHHARSERDKRFVDHHRGQ